MSQLEQELACEMHLIVPPDQVWRAFKDLHNLLPRILPGFIDSASLLEGDGGVGSIREIKFGLGLNSDERRIRSDESDELSPDLVMSMKNDVADTDGLTATATWDLACANAVVPGQSYSKERIDVLDNEQRICSCSMLSGEMMENFSSYRTTWQFNPATGGQGTDVKWKIEYVPVGEHGSLDKFKDSALLMVKQIEGHLIATAEYTPPSQQQKLRAALLS
ncbi:hypothetical protein AXG93_1774s1350 [Marchantia polymorpha subsp. ruderalis]|uniref:Bet v I/Major latex protein domain-containing protein n=1 Tax=Marchantia polymorpha subsp. ruderalis TaxID=1480154 RepID=A0A176W3I3_MARPO|nr:hypothetical protein AXG93_1774s1350 [Marchantia polymorpha subsp. ruderalis]